MLHLFFCYFHLLAIATSRVIMVWDCLGAINIPEKFHGITLYSISQLSLLVLLVLFVIMRGPWQKRIFRWTKADTSFKIIISQNVNINVHSYCVSWLHNNGGGPTASQKRTLSNWYVLYCKTTSLQTRMMMVPRWQRHYHVDNVVIVSCPGLLCDAGHHWSLILVLVYLPSSLTNWH